MLPWNKNVIRFCEILFAVITIAVTATAPGQEWPWRGPFGNGHAPTDQVIPSDWASDQHLVWQAEVPGRGHSSPILSQGRLFLTTADEERNTQSVLAFDMESGEQLWLTECHRDVTFPRMHPKNTQASPSIAIGAGCAFAVFCNDDGVHVTRLGFDGEIVWQKRVGDWKPAQYQFGFGQSPIFHDGKLIVTSESEVDPFIMAIDPEQGETIWKTRRPIATTYGTPVVATLAGRPQLLIAGGNTVASYAPDDGEELWSVDSAWVVACGTLVWHRGLEVVYASGGYPAMQTLAVKADGSGEVVWENRVKCYEQSLIVVDDCVYGHAEGGYLYCWDAATGDELWKERLGGTESASPVLVDGKLYFTNEKGHTWVIRPNRDKFDLVVENQLGDEMFASMAVVNQRAFLRVAFYQEDGVRRERLYCIGN